MPFHNKFCEVLRRIRKETNINQQELASLCNTKQSSVSKWERGELEPNLDTLILLSSIFHISIDELVGNDDMITYNSSLTEPLIAFFNQLNEEGRAKLLEQAEFFVASGKYIEKRQKQDSEIV